MGRDDQITTSAKLFDITHESYRFNADLIEAIHKAVKLVSIGIIIGFVVMCKGLQ